MITLFTLVLTALSLFTFSSHAVPHKGTQSNIQGLTRRNNDYDLKCGNAPSVVAGTPLSPSLVPASDLTTPPAKSGSSDDWMDYLWCTVGTQTYTFFGVGMMTPAPITQSFDVSGALTSAHAVVANYVQSHKDGPIAGGNWTLTPPATNIEIFVQNSKGTMTYGILNSALSGLAEMASSFIHKETTIVFQINDGRWGEVGIGYVGFQLAGSQDNCVYDIVGGRAFPCSDVRDGWVIK